jgi:hypothetical protein
MFTSIHYSSRFQKQLQSLFKADKKAVLAARKADEILDQLRKNGGTIPVAVNLKRTKNGEHRAAKCEKYDLGAGYRLVTLRNDFSLFVVFIGTHDECDRWFKKQKEINASRESGHVEIIPADSKSDDVKESEIPGEETEDDIYEKELLSRIDDKLLCTIFEGFYQTRD